MSMKKIVWVLLLTLTWATYASAQINGSYRGNVYYVKASGSDSNDGLSKGNAWQTISKVNGFTFAPGDIVLFRGTDSFSGALKLHWIGGGIGSWDSGQPTITSTTSACITAANLYDFFIDNLVCTGSGSGVNTTAGIAITNTTGGQLINVSISNSTISGYGLPGISIAGGQSGFNNVNISGNTVHDVAGANVASTACIQVGSTPNNAALNSTVSIRNNTVYNCVGRTGVSGSSGSGIIVSEATGVVIDKNVVHDYGTGSGTSSVSASGIGVWDVKNITISGNEIYSGASATNLPNSIFLGHNSNTAKINYNYIHGNAGPGLFVKNETGFTITAVANIWAAWNVFQGNAGVGEVAIHASTGTMSNINIYNNTLYASLATAAFWCHACNNLVGEASITSSKRRDRPSI